MNIIRIQAPRARIFELCVRNYFARANSQPPVYLVIHRDGQIVEETHRGATYPPTVAWICPEDLMVLDMSPVNPNSFDKSGEYIGVEDFERFVKFFSNIQYRTRIDWENEDGSGETILRIDWTD